MPGMLWEFLEHLVATSMHLFGLKPAGWLISEDLTAARLMLTAMGKLSERAQLTAADRRVDFSGAQIQE
jgi:hypothetical protein